MPEVVPDFVELEGGEAAKQFRRVNGYLHLPALRSALQATITVTPAKEDAA